MGWWELLCVYRSAFRCARTLDPFFFLFFFPPPAILREETVCVIFCVSIAGGFDLSFPSD